MKWLKVRLRRRLRSISGKKSISSKWVGRGLLRNATKKGSYRHEKGLIISSIGADFVFAWPTAQVTIVGAATAASVIFAREIKEAKNPEEVRVKRIREFSESYENPYQAAERGYIDATITPRDTRKYISRALEALEKKTVATPWKKFSNINL